MGTETSPNRQDRANTFGRGTGLSGSPSFGAAAAALLLLMLLILLWQQRPHSLPL